MWISAIWEARTDIDQDSHELFTDVVQCRLSQQFPGDRIEHGETPERSIARVLECVTFGVP
ncbi:hypothetical protein [Caballeronia grimmiae]|nr:hypothetical protein [Caballeronia grimmiae]KDR26491.1 hypothetical protein BG57_26385 [Caballeronia grimmiae]